MSDANLASLAFIAESVLGTTPATPELQAIRYTGEALKNTKETIQSAEIRSDRQIPDLAKVGSQPDGNFNFELSYTAQQVFMAAALQAAFVSFDIDATCDLTAATELVEGTAADFDDVTVGGLVKISGAATGANNGLKRVVAKAADGSTITLAAGSLTADESAVALNFLGKTVTNGIDRKSFTFEKGIVNSSGDDFFQVFKGMVADTMELRIESKQIVTGSFGFIGTSYDLGDSTIDNAGGYTEADAGDILNGTNNMGTIEVDGVSATDRFKSIVLSVSNSLRGKDALGVDGNFDIGLGTINVSGTLNAYFLNNDLPTKIKNHTSFGLAFYLEDASGNQLHFYLPNVKPSQGDPAITAINTDVMIETAFQAIRDTTTGATIIIDAVDA